MSRWEVRTLGEVAKTGAGGTPKKSHKNYYEGGRIPWLQSGAIAQGEIYESTTFITEEGLKNSSAKMFPENTVLVAMYGATAGQVGILRFEACTNQAVCGILPSKKLLPEYTYYYFLSQKEKLIAQAIGNAQPNISQAIIKATQIPLPPLSVQREIVDRLDAAFGLIDRARANVERCVGLAGELWESVLEGAYSASVPGARKVKLKDILTVKHGFAFRSDFFATEGDHVLLTPGNFDENGGFRERGNKQKHYCGEVPEGFILEKGDLLVAMTEQAAGLLGSSLLVPDSGKYLHNQRLGLVRAKDPAMSNEYLFHLFNTKAVRQALFASGTGAKVRHTSPGKIGEVEVWVVPNRSLASKLTLKLDAAVSQLQKYKEIESLMANQVTLLGNSILSNRLNLKLNPCQF